MKKSIYFLALLVALGGIGAEIYLLKQKGKAPVANVIVEQEGLGNYATVPEFVLTDRDGNKVSNNDLKGKVWLANFIYTTCPSTCPMLSRRMANLQQAVFEAGGDRVRLVSFSVDPEHDTPEVLADYAKALEARKEWHFLTGPGDQLHRVARTGFLIGFDKAPGTSRDIVHSEKIALVDQNGVVRRYYNGVGEDENPKIIEDLKTLLKEGRP